MPKTITTNDPAMRLYFAERSDVGLILQFISELAEYEKLSHEVIADEALLAKNLFDERRSAEVIIALYEEKPAGFALFFHNFSTFVGKPGIYLEDLFVRPEFRGKGIGKVLLKTLAKVAVERDCGRVDWAVLDWNQSAMDFYQSLGAKPVDDWTIFRLTQEAMVKLAVD